MDKMKTLNKLLSFLSVFILSVALFTTSSCKKEEVCDYPNQTSSDIVGSVALYDDAKIPQDKSGMVVSIVGSIPLISDTSDSNGNFRLANIKFGNYSLQYSKNGYGTFLFGVGHTDECALQTDVQVLHLGKKSTTTITSLSAEVISVNVDINVGFFPFGTSEVPRYFRIFFSHLSDVSNSSYDFESGILFTESNAETINLHITDINAMGFESGETVYVTAYGDSFYSNVYFDVILERLVFPNTNIQTPPNAEFVVP